MKEFFIRLAYKLTGLKALFAMAVLAILVLHDLSPENADVMTKLIYSVLGAKAAQYAAEATAGTLKARRAEKDAED